MSWISKLWNGLAKVFKSKPAQDALAAVEAQLAEEWAELWAKYYPQIRTVVERNYAQFHTMPLRQWKDLVFQQVDDMFPDLPGTVKSAAIDFAYKVVVRGFASLLK